MMSTNYYTREEVKKHSNSDSVWIIIKSSVYDVTNYLNEHPGGGELIKECAGKDATSDFNNFGHSGDACNLMKLYKIGEIKESNMKKTESGKENTWRKRQMLFPLFRTCTNRR